MMKRIRSPFRLLPLTVLAASLALAACSQEPAQPPLDTAPLYGSTIKPAFDLIDENGKATKFSDSNGKYRIIYFGYAYCPDVCPVDVQRMIGGLKIYQEKHPELAEKILPMFVTIDPERDTPEVLREFTDNYSDRLIGFTGSPEQIKQAAKNFFVHYERGEEGEDGAYLMDHSTVGYLIGSDGQAIAPLPLDEGPEAVAAELALWVR